MAIYTDHTFRANGKLLLTAEYFVLDGALALALPTQVGQSLKIQSLPDSNNILQWTSLTHQGDAWFSGEFDLQNLTCLKSTDKETGKKLEQIFKALKTLQPGWPSPVQPFTVTTHLEFDRAWGLGSSSTLITTLAQWAGVNPYQLLELTFGGSGYDLACASADGPIFFQRHQEGYKSQASHFQPAFHDQLYFVYLGKKQNSREGIDRYRQQKKTPPIRKISKLTLAIAESKSLAEFSGLLEKHEQLVASFIGLPTVKEKHFADYWGTVKSLGAWGGDFVLFTSDRSEAETREFCNEKGFKVFLKYNNLIL